MRVGWADGQYKAVSEPSRCGGPRRHCGQPHEADQPGANQLRLAALHRSGTAQAGGAEERHAVYGPAACAAEIHLDKNWTIPIGLLAERETIERLTKGEKVEINEENDILPRRTYVMNADGTKSLFRFYETTACHSYHEMENGVRVASIPTTLQFFFAYLYSGAQEDNVANVLCIAQRLVDIAKSKAKRRFDILTPKECIGIQESFIEMKRNKAELFEELGKDRSSKKFLENFFTYNPDDATSKKKAKASVKKLKSSSETKDQ